ncbi:[NiFe] hydrogenase nickel incorporation protein HypA [hydrothermal vent metagenome]|uniref:[NiFe] hydrogenase nickel incorporation protein HypA n=1 Tax=hydrothermal vent metagenome TaxID=652676 RepID=A0A1W1ED09_9ZZZZ
MHEYSIVQALINQCDEISKQNDEKKVTKVVIKIGVMSGVEIHLLETAFHTFKESTCCDRAELQINHQKIKLHCNTCNQEYEIDDTEYQCTNCSSSDVRIIDGEDMYLMSLELE